MAAPQPAYQKDLFVDHEREIQIVQDAVLDAIRRKPDRTRAVTFYGERGCGKTWLARHLGQHALKDIGFENVSVLSLFLAPPAAEPTPEKDAPYWFVTGEKSQAPQDFVDAALNWVCTQWGLLHTKKPTAAEMTYWLGRDLPRRVESTFVLLVDSVFEVNREWLPLLEDHLLAPIAGLENGIVIMTGRGAPFPWRSVPLRNAHREEVLTPFSPIGVTEQLERSKLDADLVRVAHIVSLGGGYPLNSYVLAQSVPPESGLDRLLDILLDFVNSDQQLQTREALESLCVLDRFREREIGSLLAFYRFCRERSEDTQLATAEEARRVRDILLENYLIRWEDDGYMINDSVRIAYRSYLQYQRPELFKCLLKHAERMYSQWAEQYPNARTHYGQQADYVRALHPQRTVAEGQRADA